MGISMALAPLEWIMREVKNAAGHVPETITETNPDYETWIAHDQSLVAYITSMLLEEVLAGVDDDLSTLELWNGAGTYMFRIDDKRVIDATRAGSLAHLINHSCEPNCYSRVISVSGDEHIIIFAKRDIGQWEELTYDYRFFSIDQQLACYCGFPRCRGVVNDTEAEEQVSIIRVPRHELTDWKAE
ncbi:Histone-lysine N-methyltransferase trithorax [Nymphaea thermarum]|nr:Histone-lysine N-methyltransferase trithorax [Nymphaea thermarum]